MIARILPVVLVALVAGASSFVRQHQSAAPTTPPAPFSALVAPVGVLQGGPSLSAAQIDAILAGYGSPAQGTGADFYNLGVEYGIDPAYALAFFVVESTAGTNPSWDGHKPDGTTTHDIGNISCANYPTCYGRWRDYDSWRTGIEDWYRLISVEYIEGHGHQTVDDVIPVYAPAFENDVDGYTNTVSALVGKWRAEYGMEETQPVFLQSTFTSNPISLDGDCGWNVAVALEANGGALQSITLAPGDVFSFNASVGNPALVPWRYCAGVPAGNWCNLAARYAQVARALGLTPEFEDHGVGDLGGGPENSIAIWNVGGQAGSDGESQDLLIRNTTPAPVTFRASVEGGVVTVEGGRG